MFCFQCEQTTRTNASVGCGGPKGVCGKDEATADLQDTLIYLAKGIGQYSTRLHKLGRARCRRRQLRPVCSLHHVDQCQLQPRSLR